VCIYVHAIYRTESEVGSYVIPKCLYKHAKHHSNVQYLAAFIDKLGNLFMLIINVWISSEFADKY